MRTAFLLFVVAVLAGAVGLAAWRQFDHRADYAEMRRLLETQPANPDRFSVDMVAGLPDPARRFFLCAIRPGTPLRTVAEIMMEGRFSLGSKENPNYMTMTATQVLAAPEGFIWKASFNKGIIRVSGSDSGTWTRFWVAGIMPVARQGGTPDSRRSAFGRYVAEAVFWTPAALLPGPGVAWEPVNQNTARVTVRHGELEQSVDVTVDAEGCAVDVVFSRWSDANPQKKFQIQPFGGHLSKYRDFGGFRLPTHVEAGNFFGTDRYFPFFIANVSKVSFPASDSASG